MNRQPSVPWAARHLNRTGRILRGALWALQGIRDRRRLEARIQGLRERWTSSAPLIRSELAPAYQTYVSTMSTARMAISLQLATFLSFVCDLTRPTRLLDLGSGFSSFVFRRYQAASDTPVEVWSVDRSAQWLESTRTFLAAQNVSTTHLETWDTFSARTLPPFDVVFYDLGRERGRFFPVAISFCASTGLFIVDDLQMNRYRRAVLKDLQGTPHAFFSLWFYTHDRFGRFAALLTDLVAAPSV
ncbi:MAG: hypothetical protein ACRDF5_02615 [bacterium]